MDTPGRLEEQRLTGLNAALALFLLVTGPEMPGAVISLAVSSSGKSLQTQLLL